MRTFPRSKFPDTSQGPILKAGLSKDSNVKPAMIIFEGTVRCHRKGYFRKQHPLSWGNNEVGIIKILKCGAVASRSKTQTYGKEVVLSWPESP